ncbi:winged helix DNA-binding protein [Croceicoccus estronivorus]|uniref:winged helix DNA-binding protein n=1 Tax=Croceicoccus estronivorus TaxID=1172626 RepID=UPI0014783C0D|nr:winged helix DNA-binding protein [Croceicoccus estronivorus]
MSSDASTPDALELREIGEKLLRWSGELERAAARARSAGGGKDQLLAIAERYYQSRRARDNRFPKDIFGEPAWDILLDLFINTRRRRTVSTTSLCIASSAPATTALRYISVLEKRGLVRRKRSRHDGRVHYVELTDSAREAMECYLADLAMHIRHLVPD